MSYVCVYEYEYEYEYAYALNEQDEKHAAKAEMKVF